MDKLLPLQSEVINDSNLIQPKQYNYEKKKVMSMFLLVAMMATVLVGCSKDDDDDNFDLNSYIIGSWHSFKGTVYVTGGQYSGISQDVEISKTGQFSQSYVVLTFQDGGRVRMGTFKNDDNGIMNWYEENGAYHISGDVVTLTESDGTSSAIVFDSKDRTLCLQGVGINDSGIPYKASIYMKK